MQLYLVHNDPLDSLLVSADGEPLYSVHTSAEPHHSPDSLYSSALSRSPDSLLSLSSGRSSFSGQTSTPASSVPSHPAPSLPPIKTHHVSAPPSPPPSPQPKHRQAPTNAHPAIPIARTHSNPHPHDHHDHPDPSSPHPSPTISPTHTHRPPASPSSGSPTSPSPPSPVTSIKRLERHQFSRGNVETEVGRIEYGGDDVGTRVQLCHTGIEMCAPAVPTRHSKAGRSAPASRTVSRQNDAGTALDAFRDFCLESQKKKNSVVPSPTAPVHEYTRDDDDEFIPDPTWSFNGPDNLPYKWLSLASCPVLIHDTQPTPTPVARYRPAKLGIVSRSRRGFLEILPRGLEMEDWIVVTFVGYFRMKLGGDIPLTRGRASYMRHEPQALAPLPTAPMGVVGAGVGVGMPYAPHVPVTLSAPVSPMRSPRYLSPLKPPVSPSPLAYLESLRRKGRDYAASKRN